MWDNETEGNTQCAILANFIFTLVSFLSMWHV